ncbi:sulfite reductase, subunit B [Desulfofarcimen acetoxidans DSM 771]|jgi:anaerobic sulfite reductase subunit B|uniref:Sulfite reductase, subunit B n=1 Tax=Desulfofarcimen acetoxidans (strain ATCC 49208 / DSM 771 / KCTC 5769 / VKM B-1644 / 5575) TaxID=485916 RepID=C8VWA9_DESAS|nr:anaerobic sulfite reductase subunit AsrB [Desulfofarcimen acetoxidans]ACV62461.1 sulfite reductase, subunit B [Desulfofarcimen acetoxidans DSM 771]
MAVNVYAPHRAKILNINRQTEIDYTFTLEADVKPLNGQFLEVSVPRVGECPISVSDFGEGYLELTIRRVGKVTNFIHDLKVGDSLFIRGPYGKGFPLAAFLGKRLIIAAGGTGLAPVKSVINNFCRNPGDIDKLDLLAGFKTPADVLFKAELQEWSKKFNVQVTVDKGDSSWSGRVGLITNLVKELTIENTDNTRVIIVGPPLMMKFTALEFINKSIPEKNIWFSFERKMCCGIGKCGHCKIDNTYVCLEGPVINYVQAKRLID